MGNLHPSQGGLAGKIEAPLNEKLQTVKWGEYRLIDIFTVKNTQNIQAKDVICNSGTTPYLCASSENNAVSSYVSYEANYLDKGQCIFIGGKTFVVSYQEKDFLSNDSHNLALYIKDNRGAKKCIQLFLSSCIKHDLGHKYTWGNSISNKKIQDDVLYLPTTNDSPDFAFMEAFVAEIEAQRKSILEHYLTENGYADCTLTPEEEATLAKYDSLEWGLFNLEALFGKSTRGKRLKSDDRIAGRLPFVTAGEAAEGVSAYIGNEVEIFQKNTTTIDMFGSAKYRNYQYGADDHIAVVHTEWLNQMAAIFVTSAIHKVAHTGEFNYGRNFYAKDADALNIRLPIKNGSPDWQAMATLISAIHKQLFEKIVRHLKG